MKKRHSPPQPAAVLAADNGVIIGRISDLQKQFSDMRNVIDLSDKSAAFIRAGLAGLAAQATSPQGPQPLTGLVDWSEFQGTNTNFVPGVPNLPVNPDREPRQFAYTPGTNYTWMPRFGYGLLPYQTLRDLSFASKEIRLNVQMVKRTLRGLKHDVIQETPLVEVDDAKYKATPPNKSEVLDFWKKPDGYYDFDDWLDILLEDALTVGAATVFMYPAGKPNAQPVDATTWRILTDYDGRIPEHPAPAFIQTTYGRPNFWTSKKHLLHAPLNPTVNNPYGYSPMEFIVQAAVQSIKRDASRTGAFTDGNVPYAFVGLPVEWTPKQIQDFTEWFNATLQGDVNRSNKLMFIPHDGSGLPVAPFSAVDQNATGLDEWLMKVAAWAYGNNPSEFGLVSGSGLGGKGALDAGENAQYRGSTAVYTQWVSTLVNRISREYLDAPWAKSKWIGLEPQEDELKKAQVEDTRIKSGVWSIEYVQDQIGYPKEKYKDAPKAPPAAPGAFGAPAPANMPPGAVAPPAASALPVQPTRPPVLMPANFGKITERAVVAELLDWRDRERRRLEKHIHLAPFRAECIPPEAVDEIAEALGQAQNRADVDRIFSAQIGKAKSPAALSKMMDARPGRADPEIVRQIEQALATLGA
jgi:hypothetical protein